jgi:hypothetical protein
MSSVKEDSGPSSSGTETPTDGSDSGAVVEEGLKAVYRDIYGDLVDSNGFIYLPAPKGLGAHIITGIKTGRDGENTTMTLRVGSLGYYEDKDGNWYNPHDGAFISKRDAVMMLNNNQLPCAAEAAGIVIP